uniref:Peptidase aspartic putative domain-containing protein n=1 Tax=Glossina morsitans morsitans TaxID=37546 RepID=A0A1B0G8Y3_GLOMM
MFFQGSFRKYQNFQHDARNAYRCELCHSRGENTRMNGVSEEDLYLIKSPPRHVGSEKNFQETRNQFCFAQVRRLIQEQQCQEQKKQPYEACRLCGETHRLALCGKYRNCNLKERYEVVRKYRYCENCLDLAHLVDECLIKNQCVICRGKHHTTLHGHPFLLRNVDDDEGDSSIRLHGSSRSYDISTRFSPDIPFLTQTLLPTVWLSVIYFGNKYRRRALISPSIPITQVAEADVRLNEWDWTTRNGKSYCSISICPINGPYLKLPVMAKITTKLPRKIYPFDLNPQTECWFSEVPLADTSPTSGREISIELGADVYPQIMKLENERKRFGHRYIIAQKTIFGWTLCGRIS